MRELKELIVDAQQLDKEAMYDIIKKFNPIIVKYTRKMGYDDDFQSDMILHLIETVYSINLNKFRISNDYALINYIANSLYHKYILLSKAQTSIKYYEKHPGIEDLDEWLENDKNVTEAINTILLDNTIKQILTEKEYFCVKLMVIEGYSSTQAATVLGISRQTVNENKNRGLKKLKFALL